MIGRLAVAVVAGMGRCCWAMDEVGLGARVGITTRAQGERERAREREHVQSHQRALECKSDCSSTGALRSNGAQRERVGSVEDREEHRERARERHVRCSVLAKRAPGATTMRVARKIAVRKAKAMVQ